MIYEWENEAWYQEHKARWDALKLKGWSFYKPQELPNRVGLTICREQDHYTMYVAKDWTTEEIHADLLQRCEYHAAYADHASVSSL